MADPETRVPIAEVAAEAYRSVFGRLGLLLDRTWLPLLVLLAATLLPGYLHLYLGVRSRLLDWQDPAFGFGTDDAIEAAAGLVCLSAVAVRWHQTMLFGGEGNAPAGLFPSAWARFLLYTLVLYLVFAGLF